MRRWKKRSKIVYESTNSRLFVIGGVGGDVLDKTFYFNVL